MKKITFIAVLMTLLNYGFAQQQNTLDNIAKRNKIKVFLLGTFHFAQTDSTYDVLTEENQKSIHELCQLIANQEPDKIFVERQPEYEYSNKIDSLYVRYLLDDHISQRNEIYQVGFRVAKLLNHNKVYQCDHPGRYGYLYKAAKTYADTNNQTGIIDAKRVGTVEREDDIINEDDLMQNSSLLDYIRWINSDKVSTSAHAFYIANLLLLGSDKYYDYDDDNTLLGAEITADWYSRNIMIYAKMINQLTFDEKAIFLIIGSEHIPIIRNLFRDHPYFEVVDTKYWLD